MIVSVAHPEPSPDGGAQLVRDWDPVGEVKADIVLVHGIGEHSGRYARTGSLLAEAGYRVRGFDLLGFGASSGERADIARWSLFLDQVEGNLNSVRTPGRPVILMGHSMGGLIALDFALAERPRPDLLILSSPALGGGKGWQRSVAPVLARLFPTMAAPTTVRGDQLSRDPRVGEAYFADPLVLTKASFRLGGVDFRYPGPPDAGTRWAHDSDAGNSRRSGHTRPNRFDRDPDLGQWSGSSGLSGVAA